MAPVLELPREEAQVVAEAYAQETAALPAKRVRVVDAREGAGEAPAQRVPDMTDAWRGQEDRG